MTRALAIIAVLTLGGCGFFKSLIPPPASPALPAQPEVDLLQRAWDNTIALTTDAEDVFCSGVVAEGVFMTAYHCVNDDSSFKVLYMGKYYEGRVTLTIEDQDLAFIDAIGARVKDSVPLTEWKPVVGQRVIWVGYPLGVEKYMGTGTVAAVNLEAEFIEPGFFAVYGQYIPGNSGGPVFDESGKLMGIVSSTLAKNGQLFPVGYTIPPHTIREALEAL